MKLSPYILTAIIANLLGIIIGFGAASITFYLHDKRMSLLTSIDRSNEYATLINFLELSEIEKTEKYLKTHLGYSLDRLEFLAGNERSSTFKDNEPLIRRLLGYRDGITKRTKSEATESSPLPDAK